MAGSLFSTTTITNSSHSIDNHSSLHHSSLHTLCVGLPLQSPNPSLFKEASAQFIPITATHNHKTIMLHRCNLMHIPRLYLLLSLFLSPANSQFSTITTHSNYLVFFFRFEEPLKPSYLPSRRCQSQLPSPSISHQSMLSTGAASSGPCLHRIHGAHPDQTHGLHRASVLPNISPSW